MSGHNNTKQKIQHLTQLKKELDEHAQTVKTQRDMIIDITLERDSLKAELGALKTTFISSSAENEALDKLAKGVLTRNQRKALQDVSNSNNSASITNI